MTRKIIIIFIEHYYKNVGSNRHYLSLRIRGEAGTEDELISEFNRRHNKSGQDEMQIDEIKAAIYKQQQKIVYEANKVIESVQMRASNAERLLSDQHSMLDEMKKEIAELKEKLEKKTRK